MLWRAEDLPSPVRGAMPEGDPFLELVLDESNSIRWHYDLVHLVFEKEGAEAAVNLIPIGRVGDRLIVAASKDSWSRTVAERILPRNSLQKPLLIEVGLALHSEPETLLPEETTRLWLGLLEKKSEKELVPGRDLDALADPWFDDITDGQLRIAFAEALVDAAESQYAFQSAPEDPPLEQRMSVLEDSLRQIQIGLQKVIEPGKHPAIATKAAARPGTGKSLAPATKPGGGGLKIPGLDPAVVTSALSAGIPEEQLRRLAAIAGKTSKMQDIPQTRGARRQNVLGETDDEEGGPEERGAEAEEEERAEEVLEGAPIEKAVLQLTKLVGQIVKPGQRDLEALLDGADSGSMDASSSSSGKSKAAAYKKLRAALGDNPSMIYRSIEAQMRGFRASPNSSRHCRSLCQQQGLGRAQEQSDQLPFGSPCHMDSGCNTRLFEKWSVRRSSQPCCLSTSCLGSSGVRPRRMASLPGDPVGGAPLLIKASRNTEFQRHGNRPAQN